MPLIQLLRKIKESKENIFFILLSNINSKCQYENLFDEIITIPLLNDKERINLYESLKDENYIPHYSFSESVDLIKIANSSFSFTSADIIILLQKAYLKSLPSGIISQSNLIETLNNYTPISLMIGGINWKVEIPEVSWESIKGLDDVKQKLIEMIIYPQKYKDLFILSPPRGILFYGKPGTGKTLLAKGLAHYTNYHFLPITISDIMSPYVGESEKIIHNIFLTAKRCQYIIILFIDHVYYFLMNFKQYLVEKNHQVQ